ncbi:MAG: PKD domain-containing protein [Bacteroidales bacterium]|jgi:PKD repeat protein|nr:PKD domain-containing protein [Bacteroidales bacterium]
MKRIFLLLAVLPLLLVSCESTPEAGFYVDELEPEVGQKVFFTNDSQNAVSFEWDFGDGFISNESNPVHIFNTTGTFEVTLTAISDSGIEDIASITIKVLVPTLLEIEVVEYFDEYVVPDASVILYPTSVDWDEQTNMIGEGFTDKYGIVVFANLEPYVHYVDVWEKDHDNYSLRDEDIGFIRTPEVIPHRINRFTAWVDYVDHGKGSGRNGRQAIIKKLERKAAGKPLKEGDDVAGWEELYKKRVK